MDLETLFRRHRKFRSEAGPLGPYLDGFFASISGIGYTYGYIRSLARGAVRFGRYLAKRRLFDPGMLDNAHVKGFIATTHAYPHAASHVLKYLRRVGAVPPAAPAAVPIYTPLLEEWLDFLARHQGLGPQCLADYRRHIARFLDRLGPDAFPSRFSLLTPQRVRDYIRMKAPAYSRSQRKALVSTLRIFLRYAFSRGHIQRDLTVAVERVPSFKHEALPRGPRWEDVLKLLQTPDRRTAQGRRDLAILLILVTYGVRGGQASLLTLDDIDWRGMTIRFPAAKRGRRIEVPLTAPVGEAITDYLRRGRPGADSRRLFLTLLPPFRPVVPQNVYHIVSRAFRLAGISSPHYGSHAIRHAWATRMLNQGNALKTIADLLGHRLIETTRIYAKVDSSRLRQVALPWPLEARP